MIRLVYVTTEWDYDLKAEVFIVRGDKGYAHTTDTLLSEVGDERDNSIIEYFTALFNVDVVRDRGNSKVVIYDGEEAIPLFVDGNQVEMLDWEQNDQPKTFTLKLGYDVEHKIYAKYLGNDKGLSSKSQILILSEPLPNLYGTLIERTTDTSQFEANTAINIPIQFTTNRTFESAETKELNIYVNGIWKNSNSLTLNAGQTTATTTLILPDGLESGLHQIEIKFEGDDHNEASTLPFKISVGYKVEIIDHTPLIAVTPTAIEDYNYIKCRVIDYLNVPKENAQIRLESTTNNELYVTTTDSDGIATFNQITTLPETVTAEYSQYSSEALSLPVIRVNDFRLGAERVIADGYSAKAQITILDWDWLHNRKTNLEGIPVLFYDTMGRESKYYTNGEGMVSIPYVGANRGNITLNADIGYSMTKSASIEDLTQYWSTQTGFINKNYKIISTNFYELNSSFKFEVRADNNMSIIGLGDGEYYEGNWTLSFKVASASSNLTFIAGDWFDSEHQTLENLLLTPASLKAGQTVTVTYTDGVLTATLPNGESNSIECQSRGYPALGIVAPTAKSYLSIDNLKFRRVE